MKKSLIFLMIVSLLFSLSCSKKEKIEALKWQGKIEYEDGVKVVKNPAEPVYGEILFDLEEDLSIGNESDENLIFYKVTDIATDNQRNIYVLDSGNFRIQKFNSDGQYLQSIGKKGQGPGEFEGPSRVFLNNQDNIYVADGSGRRGNSRMIKMFNNHGEFVKTIHLESPISDFCVDSGGNIFAHVVLSVEDGNRSAFLKMNSEGKIIKNIAEFSDVKIVTKKSNEMRASFRVHHYYTPHLSFSPLNDQTFSYAYSSEYQVFIVDNNGEPILKIKKEEASHSISQSEKKFIIGKLEESISRSGTKWPEGVLEEACSFPSTRPFFRRIIVDDMQRLFLWRVKSVLDKSKDRECDVFSKKGYFLYCAKIPVLPEIINKGFLYDIKEDEEIGGIFIRRFRIKNWDQIKEGL